MAAPKQGRRPNQPGRGPGGTARGAGGNGGAARGGSGRSGAAVRRPEAAPVPARKAKPVPAKPAQGRPAQTRKARDRARARELAERRAVAAPVKVGPPRWVQLTSLVLALAGLGISIYLTIEHFTGNSTLACADNSVSNCAKVTTSPESMVFGVFPVAVLGLAFFVFMVAVTTPMAWRSARREVALARLGSVVVGVGFILYLIYVELIQVGSICLWCTGVHAITFLLFVLVAMTAAVWGLVPVSDSKAR